MAKTEPPPTIAKTFKFRLVPRPDARKAMAQHAGACRFVWNMAKHYADAIREGGGKFPGFFGEEGFAAWFVRLRKSEETKWLNDLSCASVRYSVKRLDLAYRAAFRRLKSGLAAGESAGFPKFHARRDDESFTIPQAASFKLGPRAIRLEKIGWVRMRPNRGRGNCEVEGAPKMVVVKREGGKWFACVQCEIPAPNPLPHSGGAVGVDMGCAKTGEENRKTVSTSDGKVLPTPENPKLEARRRRYQRAMARKRAAALRGVGWDGKSETRKAAEIELSDRLKARRESGDSLSKREAKFGVSKYGVGYAVAQKRAAKASAKLTNIRRNSQHQISRFLADAHALVVVEDLRVKNMTASAAGTEENPGKNVAQKRGLNREILSQGWAALRTMIDYKSAWVGGKMVVVPPHYTSRTCAECGREEAESRSGQKFRCVFCGHSDDADVNAARNILSRGLGLDGEDLAHGVRATARGGGGVSRPKNRGISSGKKRETPVPRALSGPQNPEKQGELWPSVAEGPRNG